MNRIKFKNQQGAAIIVALFVVALVVAAATIMIQRLRIDMRRTELILNANKANLYAQGSIAWAIDLLNSNLKSQQPNKVVDKTPIKSPLDKEEGITIFSVIYDAQALFNINNLMDEQYQNVYARLITLVAPQVPPPAAQNIMRATLDWISVKAKNPELDEYYVKLNPSYRAPHRLMVNASELRLVKGINAKLFAQLLPYVIALPKTTPININNAPAPVIMSLSPTMTADSAKSIQALVQKKPFASIGDFLNFDVIKNNPIDSNKITVISNYFLIVTNVTVEEQTLTLYTLVEREKQGADVKTVILWQSKGTL